MPFQQVRFLFI